MQIASDLSMNGLHMPETASVAPSDPEAISETPPRRRGVYRALDLIPRRRDGQGNRLPWTSYHNVPTVDDTPLRETTLASALEEIRVYSPIDAAELEHEYEQKLRPALQRLVETREAEEAQLAADNEKAEQFNAALDMEIERVNRTDQNALTDLERRLSDAHSEAAHTVAQAGGVYNPELPSPDSVLRIARQNPNALAARLGLPWTPADKEALLPPLLNLILTLVIGMMIGLSLGILSGFVPAGNWLGKPFPFAFFVVAGIAAAICGKWAMKLSAREASQRYWLGKPWTNWLLFALVSVLVAILVVVIDSLVEREGLMANVRMQELARSLSGSGHSNDTGAREWLYFLMAILLTFGYAVNAYWEGYLCGRYEACCNRIVGEQEQLYTEAETVCRSDPKVQTALEVLAQVQKLLLEKRVLEARMAERTAPLETKRRVLQEHLSLEARCRIQDTYDQFIGAQATFDAKFTAAKARRRGGPTFWQRLFPKFWNRPATRPYQHDTQHLISEPSRQ